MSQQTATPPTPRPGPNLVPIEFSNFIPGIADNPGVNYPPEQAERTNTYRCIANNLGALCPGPRRTLSISGTHFEASNPTPGFYVVNGLYCAPAATNGGTASPLYTHQLFIGTEYLFGGNRVVKVERRRMFENPASNDLLKNVSSADASTSGLSWGMTFASTRANKAAVTDPGIPLVVFAWGSIVDETDSFVSTHPDDATPTSNTPYDVLIGKRALIQTHQGRIVIRLQSVYGQGVNAAWNPTEDLRWTDVYNPSVLSPVENFVPENPDGYALMVPMSANELFTLKASFGLMLQGDLNDPIAINLPMVPGTYIGQSGVVCSLGLMYGNPEFGVWLWSGGDSAQLLSPNMNPNFFILPEGLLIAQQYQWTSIGDLVFLSNNWIYDTQAHSWWRLEDENVLQTRFLTSDWTKNFLYGSVTHYTNEADTIAYEWTRGLGATSYSWQSHPIWQSIDRTVIIRQIGLVAKGRGTVTLTATTFDGSTQSITIELDNTGFPERFRRDFALQGEYVQLRIEADSGRSDVEAPTVWSATLFTDTRSRLPVR